MQLTSPVVDLRSLLELEGSDMKLEVIVRKAELSLPVDGRRPRIKRFPLLIEAFEAHTLLQLSASFTLGFSLLSRNC